MERWVEIYKNTIPKGNYQATLMNGDESGLLIKLNSNEYVVSINFGIVSALRMLDEGVILNSLFDDNEIFRYKNENFSNTIYKIVSGEFDNFIKNLANELYEIYDMKHYIIISMNHIIEIMSKWEPNIEVISK